MERYKVVHDRQGGEFGMDRNYTEEQWRKQALEWCWVDDDAHLAEMVMAVDNGYVIDFISGMWDLEFAKVGGDESISKEDEDAFCELTAEEYYDLRFGEKEDD